MINGFHNSIHPPHMEINPPKTVCGCRCGVVVKTGHADSPLTLRKNRSHGQSSHTTEKPVTRTVLSSYGKTGHTDNPLTAVRKNRSHRRSSHPTEKPAIPTILSPYGKTGHTNNSLTLWKNRPHRESSHPTEKPVIPTILSPCGKTGLTDNPLTLTIFSPCGKTCHADNPLTVRKNRSHRQSLHPMECVYQCTRLINSQEWSAGER